MAYLLNKLCKFKKALKHSYYLKLTITSYYI